MGATMKEPTPTFNGVGIQVAGFKLVQWSVLSEGVKSPPTGRAWKSLPSLPNLSSRFLAVTLTLLLLLLMKAAWKHDSLIQRQRKMESVTKTTLAVNGGEESIICLTRSSNFQFLHNPLAFPISLHLGRKSRIYLHTSAYWVEDLQPWADLEACFASGCGQDSKTLVSSESKTPASARLVLLTERALPTCKSGCKSWKTNKELQESVLSLSFWSMTNFVLQIGHNHDSVKMIWSYAAPCLCSRNESLLLMVTRSGCKRLSYPSQSLSAGDGISAAQHGKKSTRIPREKETYTFPTASDRMWKCHQQKGCLVLTHLLRTPDELCFHCYSWDDAPAGI